MGLGSLILFEAKEDSTAEDDSFILLFFWVLESGLTPIQIGHRREDMNIRPDPNAGRPLFDPDLTLNVNCRHSPIRL